MPPSSRPEPPVVLSTRWLWFNRALVVFGLVAFVVAGVGTWILSGARAVWLPWLDCRLGRWPEEEPERRPRPQELGQQHALCGLLAGSDTVEPGARRLSCSRKSVMSSRMTS